MTDESYTPGVRLGELARTRGDERALVVAKADGSEVVLTYEELDRGSNRLARRLAEAGVTPGRLVAIVLPTCAEHVLGTFAIYKLGACPMPLSVKMPAIERDRLLELGAPTTVLSDEPALGGIGRDEIQRLDHYSDDPLPEVVPQPIKAIASGGSTGRPKLIVTPGTFRYPRTHPFILLAQLRERDLMYAPGPLYHNQAFFFSQLAFFAGGSVLLNERFDAARALELIERHRPSMVNLVPTMMQRMLRVPGVHHFDLSSIRVLWHMASPCPEWAKRGWMELIGPERVWELWAATENVGIAAISGPEWLHKVGSVGKGFHTEFRIRDESGRELPQGEVGEIHSRMLGAPAAYTYLGSAPAKTDAAGFTSVGDLGWLDNDGYLYVVDRRVDMIITGGANVFPAEVEAVLSQHSGVRDVAVIGVQDDDLGRRVHAIIECPDPGSPPAHDELDRLVRAYLSAYKAPRSYEFVRELPRDEAGKIRRQMLRDQVP